MAFTLSRHAARRKKMRKVSNAEIDATLSKPDTAIAGHGPNTRKHVKVVGRFRIKVVFVDNATPPHIVTVIKDPV
jgi:hypothetical protein